ncbi:MAG: helix-turn-helix transcriptional regulator [Melioribacteraceae bacterium]|nr:helix-turn-helix transcriptional regulator [Melioribacteraceae bacterium]
MDNILKITEIKSELELERAISLYGKLRWMVKEDSSLKEKRDHLRKLISSFEDKNWSDLEKIREEQIEESDKAEELIFAEESFIQKRKSLIKNKLKSYGLKQQELGKILGHRKNYMSELINGVRPFSRDDLVIIHRLLAIELKDLIPTFIKPEIEQHIKMSLRELGKSKLKLRKKDLIVA